MNVKELGFQNLSGVPLKPYADRAPTESLQFLRWVLENIYRLEAQEADDACVDEKQDKGVDAIVVNDVLEEISIFQSKIKQKPKAKLGDTEVKEFYGTLAQFKSPESVQGLLDGKANAALKSAILRSDIKAKVQAGYSIEGVFCTNVELNSDGLDFLANVDGLTVYDAGRICSEFIELDHSSGVTGSFQFDLSDTEVITYATSEGVAARIFLANALQMTKMPGVSDGSLFSQNVRLSLGNTKVNKSLVSSIKNKSEHKNFPLYHNGVTILCESLDDSSADKLTVKNYVVVNGAQSLTSLLRAKSSITPDLKILVKAVALGSAHDLGEKITSNSNNQNAIKPRDMRSNHGIQQRLKKEIEKLNFNNFVYEVKRGEANKNKTPISNEDAGLALLAMDLGEPWSCHQKYKVMDDSHSKIFGRKDVNGQKVLALYIALQSLTDLMENCEDKLFGHYNLTKYFLAYVVSEIIKEDSEGANLFANFDPLFEKGSVEKFRDVYKDLASTTIDDLNAEIAELKDEGDFDYKRDLKSPKWCRTLCGKLKATYKKDIKRKKAMPIGDLLKF